MEMQKYMSGCTLSCWGWTVQGESGREGLAVLVCVGRVEL